MSGGIGAAVIMAGTTLAATAYSAHEQRNAQRQAQDASERAQAKAQEASKAAEKRASDRADAQQKRNEGLAADQAQVAGESATMDFTTGQNDDIGSSMDFLVPKIGGSQLGVGSNSGLGL